jgi:F-type H+-transporting ATPase subunit alpha
VPVADVRRFEEQFLDHLRRHDKGTLAAIADGTWDDDIVAALDKALSGFKENFLAGEHETKVNEPEAEPMEGEENRETVTRYRRTPPPPPA